VAEAAGKRPRAAGAEEESKNTKGGEKKAGQTEARRILVEVEECLSSALSSLRFHHAGMRRFHHAEMPLPDETPSE
jgi:hypothetical protein